jgi:hypothetical protein
MSHTREEIVHHEDAGHVSPSSISDSDRKQEEMYKEQV